MKSFEELLTNNEIEIPSKIRYFKWKKFQKEWRIVAEEYERFLETWKAKKKYFDAKIVALLKHWGEENLENKLSKLTELEPELKFKNPDECLAAMKSEILSLKTKLESIDQIEGELRKKWISQIIEKAPESCSKILVYMNISPEARNKLLKKYATIRMNGISIIAISFAIDNPPSTEEWLMTPEYATIEYVEN